jgi:hypothetical protein
MRALAEGTPEDKRLRRQLAPGEALGVSTVALARMRRSRRLRVEPDAALVRVATRLGGSERSG